mmetsp:Transcript_1880/g.2598  ORF Transcript_1880/g.2598 Transcript_1880/m.2598 type:complete len:111 (-) Transcript_1880:152-484(-)
MFKIKQSKAKRRALLFEKRDFRGDKYFSAIKNYAHLPRLKLTREQAASAIGRWWRRMLMKKFRLSCILDPVLEYRISMTLNQISKEELEKGATWDLRQIQNMPGDLSSTL